MHGEGLRKLEARRAAREREARELAQLVEEIEDADGDDDRKRALDAMEAWLNKRPLRVDSSECDLTKTLGRNESWPVVCKAADATDPAFLALERNGDFKKIMKAAKAFLRTICMSAASVSHADRTERFGASVIGCVIGCNNDGTMEKCIVVQKTVLQLLDVGGSYAGSTTLQSGLKGTFGMPNCFVVPLGIVNHSDRCIGEGGVFGAQLIATGHKYVGQCPMGGVPATLTSWAPDVADAILANPDHDLYQHALNGTPPPLTTTATSEEISAATKKGKKNMSAGAKKREADNLAKYRQKHGCGMPGKQHRSCSTEVAVLAQTKGFTYTLFIAEALECIRDKRDPAEWAKPKLTKRLLKRVADAGLAQFEFWTVLPEEEEKGVQGFDIEGFELTKEEGTLGTCHVWDWVVHTQRGPFPVYDVSVALKFFGANERPPKLPWGRGGLPSEAPAAVNALIARALAWSPPASQPSPPPAKKQRSGQPRRSKRLQK
jgi:hypothetical protein